MCCLFPKILYIYYALYSLNVDTRFLYSPLNLYLIILWILDFKYILLFFFIIIITNRQYKLDLRSHLSHIHYHYLILFCMSTSVNNIIILHIYIRVRYHLMCSNIIQCHANGKFMFLVVKLRQICCQMLFIFKRCHIYTHNK